MGRLTVRELTTSFEEKLRRIGEAGTSAAAGTAPRFPLLTVYLGRRTAEVHPLLSGCLGRLWPQYRRELAYAVAGLDGAVAELPGEENVPHGDSAPHSASFGGSPSHSASFGDSAPDSVSFDGSPSHSAAAPEKSSTELRRLAAGLFDTDTHFESYEKLLLVTLLDTGELSEAAELDSWLETAVRLRRETGVEDRNAAQLCVLLLDEGHGRQELSADIRRSLARYAAGGDRAGELPAVLLLSNRRDDNRVSTDWSGCCRIAAAAMALADSADGAGDFLQREFFTASYHREEKPFDAISQFCVCELLEELSGGEVEQTDRLFDDPAVLRNRLGLTAEGTFRFLDEAADALPEIVPEPFQLELFPLPSPDRASFQRMTEAASAREFNERTFGAWDCCLAALAERAREKVPPAAQFAAAFGAALTDRFTARELAALSEDRDRMVRLLSAAQPPSGGLPVRQYAIAYLKYLLSADPALTEALWQEIARLGQLARRTLADWRELLDSRSDLYQIQDPDLVRFYRGLLRDYFDGVGTTLRREARKVREDGELRRFLEEAMDGMLRDARLRQAAGASFEDELEYRLKTASRTVDVNRRIRGKLTGGDVPVYLQTAFNLGHPVRSFILLKKDDQRSASLYNDLLSNLPEETCYYDTALPGAAEALNLYRVSREQLL